MSDPRKQLEEGVHPEIVWEDYHAGKNPIDVLCDHLDEIESLRAQLDATKEALAEAMGWNWLEDVSPPLSVVRKCEAALKEKDDD